jgi:hypothetical protein
MVNVAVLQRTNVTKIELLYEIRVESICQQTDHSMITVETIPTTKPAQK